MKCFNLLTEILVPINIKLFNFSTNYRGHHGNNEHMQLLRFSLFVFTVIYMCDSNVLILNKFLKFVM